MAELKDEIANILKAKAAAKDQRVEAADRDRKIVESFFESVVAPAFADFAEALRVNGRTARTEVGKTSASFEVSHEGRTELNLRIVSKGGKLVSSEDRYVHDGKAIIGESTIQSKSMEYTADRLSKDDIVAHLLTTYRTHNSA
jgi:hypothetical protein